MDLNQISLLPAKEKFSKYQEYLKNLICEPQEDRIRQFLEHSIQESLGLPLSRQIFQDFIDQYRTSQNPSKQVYEIALDILQPRTVAFEDHVSQIREHLADIYQEQEDWQTAASLLKGIPLESGTRLVSDEYKFDIYIRIVRLHLEDEDVVSADAYLNRAALLYPQEKDKILQLTACQAQSLNFKRQFLPSAMKYLEISYQNVSEEEQVSALRAAITCAVLAGAGPQRSRLLATLYNDKRVKEHPDIQDNGVGAILRNMHLGRVCRPMEIQEFQKTLSPHHIATLGDGSTVFDRAIIEHNIHSVSNLYSNITFDGLGKLLSVTAENAEVIASKMISEERLQGKIDQVEKLIIFTKVSDLENWDSKIAALCHEVEDIVTDIAIKY